MGIDYGTRRIGVAAGNTEDGIATPIAAVPAEPAAKAIAEILRLAEQYQAEGIVVGHPLNMDDSEGPQAKLSRDFAGKLAESGELDVRLWDERLSSFEADEALRGRLTRKKRQRRQDAVAAAVILHDFLSRGGESE